MEVTESPLRRLVKDYLKCLRFNANKRDIALELKNRELTVDLATLRVHYAELQQCLVKQDELHTAKNNALLDILYLLLGKEHEKRVWAILEKYELSYLRIEDNTYIVETADKTYFFPLAATPGLAYAIDLVDEPNPD